MTDLRRRRTPRARSRRSRTVAVRTIFKILRTPQIVGIAIAQSIVFLLMFRYVLGGAIDVPGVDYVEFLVPGFVVSGLLFTAGGSAVAVAEDAASGIYDRFRSLPISDTAVLIGRGHRRRRVDGDRRPGHVRRRLHRRASGSTAARSTCCSRIGLLVVYALGFAGVFVWLGLVSGSAQAAQGLEHPRRAVLVRVERVRAGRHDAGRRSRRSPNGSRSRSW